MQYKTADALKALREAVGVPYDVPTEEMILMASDLINKVFESLTDVSGLFGIEKD